MGFPERDFNMREGASYVAAGTCEPINASRRGVSAILVDQTPKGFPFRSRMSAEKLMTGLGF